ncbi:T9SS type A sorting domain-containing protein, partial [Xanthomarina sp. F1114]|uniref:T9SS type A sorting domain-containing protein n=1 Tax=Xanthomarina sp. F1114 TaxID=2996019 RepID=UPI00225E3BEC
LDVGETYTVSVEGDTKGPFDNDIVAFIDWNQNGVLDDAGEVYEIGTLFDSVGDDGVSVTMDITVPMDAIEGETRIRLTKTYQDPDSPAGIDPCAIEFYPFGYGPYAGYGQALDFTLNIGSLSVDSFEANAFSVYPNPIKDVLNIKYKSALESVKVYNLLGQEVYSQNVSSSHLKLDLSSLHTGAYIVKVFANEAIHSFRVLKQ